MIINNKIEKEVYNQYLTSLINGVYKTCSKLVVQYIQKKMPVESIYENLLKESMYEVGELWKACKISVATEHLASAITEGIINEVYPLINNPEKNGMKFIISSVENEYHKIGSKMVADIFEKNGWDSYYLAKNIPIKDLGNHIEEIKPDLLGMSLALESNIPSIKADLTYLTKKFKTLPIIVGGFALVNQGNKIAAEFENNVVYIKSLEEIEKFIYSLSL